MKNLFLIFLISTMSFAQLKYLTKANISSLTSEMENHQMSIQGDNIYVCYKRGEGTSSPDREIKVSISTDKGLTWTERDITIENNNTFSPKVISTQSVVLVLYKYTDNSNQIKTCIAQSTNNGTSFNLNSINNENLASTINSIDCDIATTENGKIYVCNDNYLFLSQDNGISFNPINEPPNFSKAYYAYLNANNNNLWITFTGNDSIYCYRSENNGSSYQLLTKYFADFNYGNLATCQNNDNLAILWSEEIVGVNYLRMRVINGTSVGNINDIASANSAYYFLGLEWKQTNIWATVVSNLYYSSDNGITWSRGSQVYTETNRGIEYYDDNFYCYNDTTLFFLGEDSYISGSIKEYIFTNIKWADFPASELQNDTLFTNNIFSFDFVPYVSTPEYRIEISDTPDFANILIDTVFNNPHFFYTNIKNRLIANNTRYYYRLRGEDVSYQTSWSPNKTFLFGNKIIEIPTIVSPINSFNASWPTYINFEWTNIPNADSYEIHLSSNNNFSDTLYFYGYPYAYFFVRNNQFSGAVMYNGDVYWHVRGFEEWTGSFGPWSNTGNFHYSFTTDVGDENNNIPQKFELESYPNPFNPSTNLRFGIPNGSAGLINITIYNSLGEEIVELANERKSPGWHNVVWNASKNSSGIYFCVFKAGGHILTHKLILIK